MEEAIMTPCPLLRALLLASLVLSGPLVASPARASVVYQFLGITAALPPNEVHPRGDPPRFEAFTLTVPTFLPVPTSSIGDFHFLQITEFDSCINCSGLGVFLQNEMFGSLSNPIFSATLQFDDINDVGYGYFFLPGAFSSLGNHTTAQFDAVHGTLGPFENIGSLFVTAVPAPPTDLLLTLAIPLSFLLSRGRAVAREARKNLDRKAVGMSTEATHL
jgi:hypothetical protein